MSKIIAVLRKFASESGDLTALQGDVSSVSYREMLAAIDAIAAELGAQGIKRVGLVADNGPEWIIVDLACQCAAVPLIPLPAFFTPQQVSHAVDSSGVDALFSDQNGFGVTGKTLFGSRFSESSQPFSGLSAIKAYRVMPAAIDRVSLPDDTAKITYTSGSTGNPKGVCLSVAAQYATATALNDALKAMPLSRHLAVLPLATLLENVAGVYSALLRGAEVMLPSLATLGWAGSSGLDIQELASILTITKPDSAVLLPQILKGLIACCDAGRWQAPSSLQFLAVGGARVAPELIARARLFGLPVYEGYGLSECGSVVCVNYPGADKPGSAGKVLSHCSVRIVDGEVMVVGNAYQGYLQLDTRAPERAEVATGDLGEVDDDGFLWLRGRSKNLLVSSYGRNISPEWPESELSALPSILQCMVIGDAQPYCGAFIYPAAGLSREQINREISRCNGALPDYAQIRRWVALPKPLTTADGFLTANGRLRRQDILAHYDELVAACFSDVIDPQAVNLTLAISLSTAADIADIDLFRE